MQRRQFLKMAAVATTAAITSPLANVYGASGKSSDRPNFLFLFTDDQTFKSINALNNPDVKTPNIDRLVGRGTSFTHCFNQGAWHGAICVASRAMLNTGRYVWQCGGDSCGDYPLWGETFGNAGYNTFMTGKWHNGNKSLQRSFKTLGPTGGGMFGSKDTMAKENKAKGIVKDPYNRPRAGNTWSPYDKALTGHWRTQKDGSITHSSKLWADSAVEYIEKSVPASNDPFLMYVAFHAPHDPRQSPKEFVDMYPPESIKIPTNYLPEHPFDQGDHKIRDEVLAPFPRTKRDVQVHLSEYYAIITHADYQIGRILDALEKSGKADNTYIIFTSDHGLAVGQHGLMGKQSQYDHSVRMPLIMVGPGIAKNKTNNALVHMQSMFATTCEIAKVKAPDTVQFPSLMPLLTGKKKRLYNSVYGAYNKYQRMVRTEQYKLIRYPQVGEVQLFDLVNDPWEKVDLAEDPKFAITVQELDLELRRWMKVTGDQLDLDAKPVSSTHKPEPVAPDTKGTLKLLPENAFVTGSICYQPDKNNLGCWTEPKDTVSWQLKKVTAGKYKVDFSYGCVNPKVPFTISAGDKEIKAETISTTNIRKYQKFELGTIDLTKGKNTITIKAANFKKAIMNVRSMTLTRLG